MEESAIRRLIWERKDAVDAKIADPAFLALPADEQDAVVISVQLDVPLEVARRCVGNVAADDEMATLRNRLVETFRYGKRKALRPLRWPSPIIRICNLKHSAGRTRIQKGFPNVFQK